MSSSKGLLQPTYSVERSEAAIAEDPRSPVVRVHGLTRCYGRVAAIRDVSFTVRSGEILGLIGPNGAGKTTLLECLAGLRPRDSGNLTFRGQGEHARSSVIFYIPDEIAPWPRQSVRWALDYCQGLFAGRRELYAEVVADLHLEPLLPLAVGTLSKGQRKRVLVAIGVLSPRPVLVIDEPFEGLDLRQSRELEVVFRKHVARGRTLFLSIHQIADAARLCDRFVLLSGGAVIAEGTLDELGTLAQTKHGETPPRDLSEIFLALT